MKFLKGTKKYVATGVLLALLVALLPQVRAAQTVTAIPTKQTILLAGEPTGQKLPVYAIAGSNYMKIRDMATLMDFKVEYDAAKNAVSIDTRFHYQTDANVSTAAATAAKQAVVSPQTVFVDDELKKITMYAIDGYNYAKLRDVAAAANCGLVYVAKTNTINVDPTRCYDSRDIFGAGRIIYYQNEPMPKPVPEEKPKWEASTAERYYDASSGTVSKEKITLSPADPMARENFWENYARDEAKAAAIREGYNLDGINATIQSFLDMELQTGDVSGPGYTDAYYKYAYYFKEDGTKVPNLGTIYNLGSGYGLANKEYGMSVVITYSVSNGGRDNTDGLREAELLRPIMDHCATLKTDREKATYLARVMCDRLDYNGQNNKTPHEEWSKGFREAGSNNVIDIFNDDVLHYTTCQGFADIYSKLCRHAGLVVDKEVNDTHMWNRVYLADEDKWVVVDVTWADGFYDENTGEYTQAPMSHFNQYVCVDKSNYVNTAKRGTPSDSFVVSDEMIRIWKMLEK